MNEPRISIGMPVFNGGRYLREAVEAARAQTLTGWQLVISDNASTDDTWEQCQAFAAEDPRIRVYRNERNLGAAANFNRVFELARGEYFKWASADDLFAPALLERCVATLDAHPEIVLCYGKSTLIDENGARIGDHEDGFDLRMSDVRERFDHARSHRGLLNVLHGVMRRKTLENTRLMGNFPGSDEVLAVELALAGQICEIPDRLFFRRMHSEAASAGSTFEERQKHLDPTRSRTSFMWYWRHYFEQLKAVWRAPPRLTVKLSLSGAVLRTAIQSRDNLLRELREGLTRG